MIYEHSYLTISSAQSDAFEAAFASAKQELLESPGCRSVALHRSVDSPEIYLLKVGWDRIEDHLEVFPTTENSRRFANAIARFFESEPQVLHFPV